MAETSTILYGTELITREDATARVLLRLLDRLPHALWNTAADASTVQRDLLRAFAEQMALWLENRTTARSMTLLLEAEGLDLDALLYDYGLKRYLQRPDATARQIGMHCLWIPKGTLHALSRLADLLVDIPHVALYTGRNEAHILLADSQPVTAPASYWGLVSDEGVWYAVMVHQGHPAINVIPIPGVDVSPGDQTLHWFTVWDETDTPWYVTITGDSLHIELDPPAWGAGTSEAFRVLETGIGTWTFRADSRLRTLEPVLLDPPAQPFDYWLFTAQDTSIVYALWMDDDLPVIDPTPPLNGVNATPTSTPLDWAFVWDETNTPWALVVRGDTLQADPVLPSDGISTDVPIRLMNVLQEIWGLQVLAPEEIIFSLLLVPADAEEPPPPVLTLLTPRYPYEAFRIQDQYFTDWWLSIEGDDPVLDPTRPVGAIDVTPPGDFQWLRLYDTNDGLWYGYPTPHGLWRVEQFNPDGAGTKAPQTLGDAQGRSWQLGVGGAGTFGIRAATHEDFDGLQTALVLNDRLGNRWCWRLNDPPTTLEISTVMWPDTISQIPWGEIGAIRLSNTAGGVRYLYPDIDGTPLARKAPPLHNWGIWTESLGLRDRDGNIWHIVLDGSDMLSVSQSGVLDDSDIAVQGTLLSMRDIAQACDFLTPAGSLVTTIFR